MYRLNIVIFLPTDTILAAQKEAVDESVGLQKGLDEMIEQRSDGTLYYLDRIWVPLKGDVRTLIMDEAHKSKYYVKGGFQPERLARCNDYLSRRGISFLDLGGTSS
ncbi:hypothetical protein Tco_0533678 [Tanacetum coccineum]